MKMKSLFRRGLALLLIVMVIVSAISISSFAAVSQPEANTGIRGEVCTTFNGTTAPAYYTGTYSYANLSTLSSSSLKSTLNTLMTSTHKNTSSYDNCRDYSPYTDCEGGDSSYITMLYTSYSATYSQYQDGTGWNREHVWPKSLGGDSTTGGGADLHHIRPDEAKTNSTRSNRRYGNVSSGTAATGNLSGEVGGYYGGNELYEPLDNVKGDVARICLYVHVRWGSDWGASSITSVFESVDTLLEWCALDPVDTWEMERNDVIEGVQGNRNVFIDYPELAWQLFGETVPTDLVSPSDGVENGTVSGGGSEGGTEGGDDSGSGDSGTTTDPETPEIDVSGDKIVFEFGENGEAKHSDGSETTSYTETNGNYTLTLGSCSKVYKNARDMLGNSALKLGTGSYTASFSFTVPDDVKAVILSIAGYKADTAQLTINGASYTVSSSSNSGEYTDISIDTTTDKTVSVATTSGGYRAMLNSITYVLTTDSGTEGGGDDSGSGDSGTTTDPVDPTPDTPEEDVTTTGSATLTFDDTSKRTSFSTSAQVWEENGITFTNNKSSESNNVADYSNPVRIYKSSQIIIESPSMVKIVINCDSSYVTGTTTGLTNAGYNAKADGTVVTVTFDSAVDSITFTASEQTRINSIEVFYASSDSGSDEGGSTTPEEPVDPAPNPGEDIGGEEGGSSSGTTSNVTFEFGENGEAKHSDGSGATSYTETVGDYTLELSIGSGVYKNARDALGNSALKLGSGSATGSFSFTVPDEVNSVIIQVAQYKANATVVTVNGTQYTITTASNNGEYTEITVDTTTTKTVSFATTTSGKRAMINSITYVMSTGGCESGNHNTNEHGYCKNCDAGFRTATLVLSSDLAMRYGIEIVNAALLDLGAPRMIYTFNGKTHEVADYDITDGYYVFAFEGIAPDEMTLIITADFYIGDTLVATFTDYSVETNLFSLREKNSTDTTLVQLINDVLIYGRAAQEFTGENSSDLAGADASDVNASTDTPTDETLIEGNANANMYIKSIGVHFNCVNYVYIKIYVSDPALFGAVTVGDKSYALSDMVNLGGGNYRLNFDPAQPTAFDNLMLITLTGADSVDYTTVIYSINCYASYMYNGGAAEGSAMYNLALALYRYGRSAVAYSAAHAS